MTRTEKRLMTRIIKTLLDNFLKHRQPNRNKCKKLEQRSEPKNYALNVQ